jgi:hypothetical protein
MCGLVCCCCDCWLFDTISGCLGVCHFWPSFSFLWCCRAFIILSQCICNMNTCYCSGWRKFCAYDFLVDFAASAAGRMWSLTMQACCWLCLWYSALWYATLRASWSVCTVPLCVDVCMASLAFSFGEVAELGLSYFVDTLCGILHCCWLLF